MKPKHARGTTQQPNIADEKCAFAESQERSADISLLKGLGWVQLNLVGLFVQYHNKKDIEAQIAF